MRLHSDEWWMVENGVRYRPRAEERERVNVYVHRQIHFTLRSLYVGDEELRLKVCELSITLYFAIVVVVLPVNHWACCALRYCC